MRRTSTDEHFDVQAAVLCAEIHTGSVVEVAWCCNNVLFKHAPFAVHCRAIGRSQFQSVQWCNQLEYKIISKLSTT